METIHANRDLFDPQTRFADYRRCIRSYVRHIETEMSLGNITSIALLDEAIDGLVVHDEALARASDTFGIFSDSSPYEWRDVIAPDAFAAALVQQNGNLDVVVRELVQSVVRLDVSRMLAETEAYAFLETGSSQRVVVFKRLRQVILFDGCWKSEVAVLGNFPETPMAYRLGLDIAHYNADGQDVYVATDQDAPSIAWRSAKIYHTDALTFEDLAELGVAMLGQYGFPARMLWLVKVRRVEEFCDLYGREFADDLCLLQKRFVLYCHESGDVQLHRGFDDVFELQEGCGWMGESLEI